MLGALVLRLPREVKPELEHLDAVGDQAGLEFADKENLLLEQVRIDAFFRRFGKERRVARPEHDAGLALWRQVQPEPVGPGEPALPLVGGAEGKRVDMPRIHPLVDQVDRFALAGAVDAGHHDQQRPVPQVKVPILFVDQTHAQVRLEFFVLGNRDLRVGLSFLKHGVLAC